VSNLVLAPLLVPLATALVCMFVRNRRAQRLVSLAGTFLLLLVAVLLVLEVRGGILVHHLGGWMPPFGIVFVADMLAALMVAVTAAIAFATSIYSLASIDPARERWGYHALLHIMLMGICGAFLTGDLFNLYVWFEVLLIASFVLLALGGSRDQMEGAMKYVTINLIASALFLSAVGILYGLTGTLNMADLATRVQASDHQGLVAAVAILFLAAFGIKAAVFPLYFWLPASYHTPPPAVSAVFAGLLTKVGVYAILRVFTLIFTPDVGIAHDALLWVAGLTMVTGVLGAVAQEEFRRILSFHIVSQIGYMVLGIALATPAAIAAAVFYIIHHILVKSNLFFAAGIAARLQGSYRLERLGGLATSRPMLAVLFLIPAMSLAGLPPLSGFWAKLLIVRASLEAGEVILVVAALAVGLVTLLSMTKIWSQAYWGTGPPVASLSRRENAFWMLPMLFLATLTLLLGFFPSTLLGLSEAAARELTGRTDYLQAVLGAP
jgi:multicomponent Na+:H+ antiporter subunit D